MHRSVLITQRQGISTTNLKQQFHSTFKDLKQNTMCNIVFTSLVFDEASQIITLKGNADCSQITASITSPNFTIA